MFPRSFAHFSDYTRYMKRAKLLGHAVSLTFCIVGPSSPGLYIASGNNDDDDCSIYLNPYLTVGGGGVNLASLPRIAENHSFSILNTHIFCTIHCRFFYDMYLKFKFLTQKIFMQPIPENS